MNIKKTNIKENLRRRLYIRSMLTVRDPGGSLTRSSLRAESDPPRSSHDPGGSLLAPVGLHIVRVLFGS